MDGLERVTYEAWVLGTVDAPAVATVERRTYGCHLDPQVAADKLCSKTRRSVLPISVNHLTKELHESGVEGNATIEEWQTSYAKLENMLDAALKENEELNGKHAGALNASEVENKDVRIADHSA